MGTVLDQVTTIDAGGHTVHVGPGALQALEARLAAEPTGTRTFILGDENTLHHCLPELLHTVPVLQEAEVLSVQAGESSKSISCCQNIWEELLGHAADRNAILIDLGGGVITDLGGFVAGTFKRGIRFINLPTTLMGMVDAAIGGKTGVDLGGVKNPIGLFNDPFMVCVHAPFLRTLGKRELLNGVAEMLKHGLIRDATHWQAIRKAPLHDMQALLPLITRSVEIKAAIVKEDPMEQGSRRLLNFGHTIGHGIEAHSWEGAHRPFLHGEAVAMGMVCEAWLSWRMGLLEREAYDEIAAHLLDLYKPYPLDSTGHYRVLELMRNDKKNVEGQFRFTLLSAIGEGCVDVRVNASQVQEALEHYRALVQMAGKVQE
jgi:3-dehydroquinate synthase